MVEAIHPKDAGDTLNVSSLFTQPAKERLSKKRLKIIEKINAKDPRDRSKLPKLADMGADSLAEDQDFIKLNFTGCEDMQHALLVDPVPSIKESAQDKVS